VGRFQSGAGGGPINFDADGLFAPTTSTAEERAENEPPTFLYAMDLGDGVAFLERNLAGPGASRSRMYLRGASSGGWRSGRGDRSDPDQEHCLFPMNLPLPDLEPAGGGVSAGAARHGPSGLQVTLGGGPCCARRSWGGCRHPLRPLNDSQPQRGGSVAAQRAGAAVLAGQRWFA